MVGGFDLIIGGLTCNNLPSKNGKDNGEAAKDFVCYEFPRIVIEVREIMHSKASVNNFSWSMCRLIFFVNNATLIDHLKNDKWF